MGLCEHQHKTVSIVLTAGVDYQFSDTTLTFTDGTTELQQCFDFTLVVDNRLEVQEFFQVIATPSSGSAVTQFVIIDSENRKFQCI